MLAANRKDNVSGRTKVLSVSIITRNGLSQLGAWPGSRRAINIVGEYLKDERIMVPQIGSARDNVKNKWLLRLKV